MLRISYSSHDGNQIITIYSYIVIFYTCLFVDVMDELASLLKKYPNDIVN